MRGKDRRPRRPGRPEAGPGFLWRQPRAARGEGAARVRGVGVADSRKARRWRQGNRRRARVQGTPGRRILVRGAREEKKGRDGGKGRRPGFATGARSTVSRTSSLLRARREPRPSLGGRRKETSGRVTRVERGRYATWTPARWKGRRAELGEERPGTGRRGLLWGSLWIEGEVAQERRTRVSPRGRGEKAPSAEEAGRASLTGVLDSIVRRLVRRRGSKGEMRGSSEKAPVAHLAG